MTQLLPSRCGRSKYMYSGCVVRSYLLTGHTMFRPNGASEYVGLLLPRALPWALGLLIWLMTLYPGRCPGLSRYTPSG